MRHLLLAAVVALALTGAHATAAEITLIAPGGIRAAFGRPHPPIRGLDRSQGQSDRRIGRLHQGTGHQG
jgi:hypothetical protein